jgi:hypothetical protein
VRATHLRADRPHRWIRHEISVKRQILDSPYRTERLLRFMLLAYAGRAGYRQEWGPGDEWYSCTPGPTAAPARSGSRW